MDQIETKDVKIEVEPYSRIVIHEVVEYPLENFLDLILMGAHAAGGTTIPLLQWAEGVVLQIQPFNPDSEAVIEEQLKGTVHYAGVAFSLKERFEPEIRTPKGTIRLIDGGANANLSKVAIFLKSRSKYRAKD